MSKYAVAYENLNRDLTISKTDTGVIAWLWMLWYGMRVDIQQGARYYVSDPVGENAEGLIEYLRSRD